MNIGLIWDYNLKESGRPFKKDRLNQEFKHFDKVAEERDVNLFHAHYTWYRDRGLEEAWKPNGEWKKHRDVDIDAVWDVTELGKDFKEKVNREMPVINDLEFIKLCKDKMKTSREIPHVPKTLEASKDKAEELLNKDGKAVLKPRDDLGGKGVKIIESAEEYEAEENYILQEFIDTTQGIPGTSVKGPHDLRAVVVDGELVKGFVRQPEEGLISNVMQGGSIEVFDLEKTPEALETVKDVVESLQDQRPYLASVDVAYDARSESFKVIELNSSPSLSFYGDQELKEAKTEIFKAVIDTFRRL